MSTITQVRQARSHLFTIADLPFDFFPTHDMPRMVVLDGYAVVFRSVRYSMSTFCAAADDQPERVTLMVRHIPTGPEGERRGLARCHPLNETRYGSRREACRAAYNAGVAAFYVSDGHIARFRL
jgi:hypothetical protein